jgi:hypothetical protein
MFGIVALGEEIFVRIIGVAEGAVEFRLAEFGTGTIDSADD